MTAFSIDGMFSDHMVLRHSRLNPVWGTAEPGRKVTVRLSGAERTCVTDGKGSWLVWLPAPSAGTIAQMEIFCGEERILLDDVACGEVWLAGGQSNMEQPLMCMAGAKPWAEAAERTQVRLKRIPRRCQARRQAGWHFYPSENEDTPWQRADRDSAATFSAIGYVFAARLAQRLQMPVGIIECNWGGTKIQCWLPTEELKAREDTRRDLEEYLAVRDALGKRAHQLLTEYERTVRQAMKNEPDFIAHNLEDPLNFLREDRHIAFIPLGGEGDPQMPGALFDHMTARVAPYGLSGVLWYQGEANAFYPEEAARYGNLFGRLLDCWRDAWMEPALPFLTCQLAPFEASMYGGKPDWPCLRAQQQRCTEKYAHVSMAILADVGMERNIHPLYKEPVADRLCRLALEDVYGIPAQAHAARPVGHTWTTEGIQLHFNGPVELQEGEWPCLWAADGLQNCRPEQQSPDTLLFPGASITGNGTAIAYGQKNWFVPGVFDLSGLPVAPFVHRC